MTAIMKRIYLLLFMACLVLSLHADYNGTIYTPNGTAVTVTYKTELSAEELSYIMNDAINSYPQAVVKGGATNSYNSHGYAWNTTEGGVACWINFNQISKYWNDGSYVSTTESNATKIVYTMDMHSAVKSGVNYRSKWGAGPLMEHLPTYGPFNYSGTRTYYKKPGSNTGGGSTTPSYTTGEITCTESRSTYPLNTSYTFRNTTYSSSSYTYNWSATTEKGDDAVDKGSISLTVNSTRNSATVRFLRSGIYYLYLKVYSGSTLIGDFSCEVIAEE